MLKAPVKDSEPYGIFCNALRSLSQRSPGEINNIINQLEPQQKKFIGELFQAKKIEVTQNNGEQVTVTRRIVKVQRRTKPATKGKQNEGTLPSNGS